MEAGASEEGAGEARGASEAGPSGEAEVTGDPADAEEAGDVIDRTGFNGVSGAVDARVSDDIEAFDMSVGGGIDVACGVDTGEVGVVEFLGADEAVTPALLADVLKGMIATPKGTIDTPVSVASDESGNGLANTRALSARQVRPANLKMYILGGKTGTRRTEVVQIDALDTVI